MSITKKEINKVISAIIIGLGLFMVSDPLKAYMLELFPGKQLIIGSAFIFFGLYYFNY